MGISKEVPNKYWFIAGKIMYNCFFKSKPCLITGGYPICDQDIQISKSKDLKGSCRDLYMRGHMVENLAQTMESDIVNYLKR